MSPLRRRRRADPAGWDRGSRGTVVVVGAGLAGLRSAERLRSAGYGGRLVIVGDEPHLPYNRTPLSKQLLTGTLRQDDLRLRSYVPLNAVWRTGTRAQGLDLERQSVLLAGGEELRYDGLVVATGVEARHLPGAPTWSDHVWMLRDLRDARAIRRRMVRPARRVVIVGGGFIGTELAATCRQQGLDVTLIQPGPTLLGRTLGPFVGGRMADLHRRAGVRLRLGRTVVGWQVSDTPGRPGRSRGRPGPPVSLMLDDGEVVDADLAVVAVGSVAAVSWLRDSGLDVSDGVLAGPSCHVIGPDGEMVPSVVVAGDVARWPNFRFGWAPRRVEHWITAAEQGQAAADALLTGPERARPFAPLPRFWTEQYGVRLQCSGIPTLADDMRLVTGSPQRMSFVAAYTYQGMVVGAVAVNAGRELLAFTPMIGRRLGAPAPALGGAATPAMAGAAAPALGGAAPAPGVMPPPRPAFPPPPLALPPPPLFPPPPTPPHGTPLPGAAPAGHEVVTGTAVSRPAEPGAVTTPAQRISHETDPRRRTGRRRAAARSRRSV